MKTFETVSGKQVINEAFELIFKKPILLLLAPISAFPLIILSIVSATFGKNLEDFIVSERWDHLFFSTFLSILTSAILTPLVFLITKTAIYSREKKIDLKSVLLESFKKFIPVFVTSFLVSLSIILGFIFFIIPGLFLSILLYFSLQFVIFENLSPIHAMSQSTKLANQNKLSVLKYMFWVFIVAVLFIVLFGLVIWGFSLLKYSISPFAEELISNLPIYFLSLSINVSNAIFYFKFSKSRSE